MKNFARTIPEENYRRDRFVTGHEEMFEAAADNRTDEHEYESALKRMQEAIKGMLGRLDDREQLIIISRFGLGGAAEQTLEQLGRELGITKERVRQIESRGVRTSSARSPASRSSTCRCSEPDLLEHQSENPEARRGLPDPRRASSLIRLITAGASRFPSRGGGYAWWARPSRGLRLRGRRRRWP